jgi:catechol 2,3-dioxygenase-like lactoylglutathione lyase family enzyme
MAANAEAEPTVSQWHKGIPAITLFVEDLNAAKQFYRQVFALSPKYEDGDSAAFDFGNTLINLLTINAVPELIEPATAAPAQAGPRMVLTIDVDDVDAGCGRLAVQGVKLLNGPMDRPWGIRTASFRDPAGHIWEIAH